MIWFLRGGSGGVNLRFREGSDFFALERKARLASERSVEARAGLERKSKKIVRRMGFGLGFMPPFSIPPEFVPGPWNGVLFRKQTPGFDCPVPGAAAKYCSV